MKVILALACLFLIVSTEVVPFDNSAIQKIFQNKKSALFLFCSNSDASVAAKQALKSLDEAEESDDIILTFTEPSDGHGLFDRLAEYLGVNTKNIPKVLYLGEKQDKYILEGQITKDSLSSFLSKVQAGQIQQFYKSAPIPQTNDQPVKIGVGKNFKQMVLDSDKQFLVKFYAPWCQHCKDLAPHYDQAAKKLLVNPNILLIKVDSTLNQIAGLQIQGFPTLKFYGKDKSQPPIEFNGDRDTEGIINWLKEHTQYDWIQPQYTKQTVQEL